jgi:hypothetical protein
LKWEIKCLEQANNNRHFVNSIIQPIIFHGETAMKHVPTILMASVIALSGGSAAAGNSNWAGIVQINVSGDILIKTDESPMVDPDACNGGNPPDFYAVAADNPAQNKLLATALTAASDT